MATLTLSETPINVHQLKKELERIKKRDGELSFRAQKTEEYLQHFGTLKNAEDLIQKLSKLDIPRLKDLHMHKIADMMPTSIEELKVILQGYTLTVNNDNLKKIMDALQEFTTKK